MVKGITKYAVTITDPNTIRYHLEKALYLATNGRPGPVWLDIPVDVQSAMIDEGQLEGFNPDELNR
jgi:acetolactate synthase-1/2/3 large subunit